MTQIRCDSCRKEIRDARRDVSYFTYLGHDICSACAEKLEQSVRGGMAKRRPYRFADYRDVLRKTIGRLTSR